MVTVEEHNVIVVFGVRTISILIKSAYLTANIFYFCSLLLNPRPIIMDNVSYNFLMGPVLVICYLMFKEIRTIIMLLMP